MKLNDGMYVYEDLHIMAGRVLYFAAFNRSGLLFPSVSFGLQVYDDDTAESLTTIALQVRFYT